MTGLLCGCSSRVDRAELMEQVCGRLESVKSYRADMTIDALSVLGYAGHEREFATSLKLQMQVGRLSKSEHLSGNYRVQEDGQDRTATLELYILTEDGAPHAYVCRDGMTWLREAAQEEMFFDFLTPELFACLSAENEGSVKKTRYEGEAAYRITSRQALEEQSGETALIRGLLGELLGMESPDFSGIIAETECIVSAQDASLLSLRLSFEDADGISVRETGEDGTESIACIRSFRLLFEPAEMDFDDERAPAVPENVREEAKRHELTKPVAGEESGTWHLYDDSRDSFVIIAAPRMFSLVREETTAYQLTFDWTDEPADSLFRIQYVLYGKNEGYTEQDLEAVLADQVRYMKKDTSLLVEEVQTGRAPGTSGEQINGGYVKYSDSSGEFSGVACSMWIDTGRAYLHAVLEGISFVSGERMLPTMQEAISLIETGLRELYPGAEQ